MVKQAPSLCPVCKSGNQFEFIMDYQKRGGEFSLYLCKTCAVQFWYPMENPGNDWYQKHNPYQVREILKTKVYRGYHTKFLERVSHLKKTTTIMDLGCGTGELVSELQKMGFVAYGLDFDKDAIAIAKKRFKLKTVSSESFDEFFARTDVPRFDIITFFEVLEHVDNHDEFIRNVQRLLKLGGKIVLSTPSRERVLVNWNKWDFPPHHFTRWNALAIENLFSHYGFVKRYLDYVETFIITMGAIDGKMRSGLVQKTLSGSSKKKNMALAKAVYMAAKVKQWVLAGIPAVVLWTHGRIKHRNNGIIYMELSDTHE